MKELKDILSFQNTKIDTETIMNIIIATAFVLLVYTIQFLTVAG